jgi:ABC-type branched-subunit amino acid transport system ATPase component
VTAQGVSPALDILKVDDVHCHFGGVKAVNGADFRVRRGGITGLLGPNGAGKTTLFNIIAGTVRPTTGKVLLEGRDVTGWRSDQLAELGMTRTFQLARGLSDLTVLENFALYAKAHPGETLWRVFLDASSVKQREEAVLQEAWKLVRRLNLAHVANNRTTDLSGGQKKLVELGRALIGEPKLLLLDEPMAGVNPALAVELGKLLVTIRDSGVTILVIEHNMNFIRQICDHVIVLAAGKVIAEGEFDEIRKNETVQLAYLGSSL